MAARQSVLEGRRQTCSIPVDVVIENSDRGIIVIDRSVK
jgi:hypothetical protein